MGGKTLKDKCNSLLERRWHAIFKLVLMGKCWVKKIRKKKKKSLTYMYISIAFLYPIILLKDGK